MSLQERIISLSEYNISFETFDGHFIITVRYDKKWRVKKPDNPEITFEVDENGDGICYYAIPIDGNIDEIFNCIDETIKYNKEMEEKVELYKEMKEKLKELFRKEALSSLKGLEFKLKKPKAEKKKKEVVSAQVTDPYNPSENWQYVPKTEYNSVSIVENSRYDVTCADVAYTPTKGQEDNKEESSSNNVSGSEIDRLVEEAITKKKKRSKK